MGASAAILLSTVLGVSGEASAATSQAPLTLTSTSYTATSGGYSLPLTTSGGTVAGQDVYVANQLTFAVTGDTAPSGTTFSTTAVNGTVSQIAVNPAGTFAYVIGDAYSVINTSTDAVVATLPLNGQAIAVNPSGTLAYVTNSLGYVTAIDTTTNTVLATISVSGYPDAVAFSPNGALAYVTSAYGAIFVFNTSTNTLESTITITGNSDGIALNPAGTIAYVAEGNSGTVTVVNLLSQQVTATIIVNTTSAQNAIAINPAGTLLYVTGGDGDLSVINTATDAVTASPLIGSEIDDIAMNAAGTFVYISSGLGAVYVVSTTTNAITATWGTGSAPAVVATVGTAVSYAVTNGTASGCATVGSTLSANTSGTCNVTATMAGDSTYAPVSSSPRRSPSPAPASPHSPSRRRPIRISLDRVPFPCPWSRAAALSRGSTPTSPTTASGTCP